MRWRRSLLVVVLLLLGLPGLAAPASAAGDEKVIGGQLAGDSWSEVVLILSPEGFQCTGTLIAPTWVLTAGHCIFDGAEVWGGSGSFATMTWAIPTISAHAHPQHSTSGYGFDYGVYELADPAPVDVDVELADYEDTELWEPGTPLSLLGFGLTDGLVPVADLRIGTLAAQADDHCATLIGPIYDPTTMLCLDQPGVSACSGDSGGPIFGLDGGRMRIVGVVSFGPQLCDSVSVGAWVPGGLSWIDSVVSGEADEPGVEGAQRYRLFGEDRFDTAAAVASAWDTAGLVYVATGENFPDSLAAGPAASASGSPILLVNRDSVPFATAAELDRLLPSQIIVVGGPAAVSDAVVDELRDHAASVQRVAGTTRLGTAIALVDLAFPDLVDAVWLAPSTSFQDPLVAGAAAAIEGVPLLLNPPGSSLDPQVRSELERIQPGRVVLVGGPDFATSGVVAELQALGAQVETVAGADPYERSANAWPSFGAGTEVVVLATGQNFPDALVGGPYAALDPPSPLLLTRRDCVPGAVEDELQRLAPAWVVILGGPAAISAEVEAFVRC